MNTHQPEPFARKPLYQQLFEVLQKRIMDGTLPENSYIPNEYDLTLEYKVSIGTVRKAVEMLVHDKLLIRQQGKGTLVADRRWIGKPDKLNRLRRAEELASYVWSKTDVRTRIDVSHAQIAEKLALPLDAKINVITQIQRSEPSSAAASTPAALTPAAVVLETIYFSAELFESGPEQPFNSVDVFEFMAIHGYSIGKVQERVTAVLASAQGAKLMAVEVGAPLLKTERLVFEKRGFPLEFRIGYAHVPDGCFYVSSD